MSEADGEPSGSGFTLVGEDVVHRGYAIEVSVATFTGPDGSTFTRDLVRHPGAVAVLPLHDDGTVTLVRQFRAPLGTTLLEIPAGLRDVADELPETTAARELAEEVGLAADHLELLCRFHNAAGHSDEEVFVYLGTGLRPVDRDLQGPEEQAMTVERHHLDDLAAMIAEGTLTDGKTVVGVAVLRSR